MMIDTMNIVICIAVIVAGIFLLINHKKYMLMFPVIFFLSAIMNACLGIKKYKMDEYSACIISFIAAAALSGLSIFSLIVVL